VRDALGQCVQAQEENAEADHSNSKEDRHDDHEHVGLARRGNKKGQMFGGSGVRLSDGGIQRKAERRSECQRNCWKSMHGQLRLRPNALSYLRLEGRLFQNTMREKHGRKMVHGIPRRPASLPR
jgi:hypothetical protein